MERYVQMKLFASLREYSPSDSENLPVSPGETVRDVLKRLGVPLSDVKLIFINGLKRELSSVLRGGERVGVFPPVGGG